MSERLEELPPIEYMFEVHTPPAGEVPEDIAQAWVGIRLPYRDVNLYSGIGLSIFSDEEIRYEEGVPIHIGDAIDTLRRYGRHEAAEWWALRRVFVGEELVLSAHEGKFFPVDETIL